MTASIESAMISRDTRLSRMPLWFIDTPSETEMVAKAMGTAPPAATPNRAASAWGPSDMEQGVLSPCVLTMPTSGLPRSSSSRPLARRNARCGVRSRPSMAMRERLRRLPITESRSHERPAHALRPLPRGGGEKGDVGLCGDELGTAPDGGGLAVHVAVAA